MQIQMVKNMGEIKYIKYQYDGQNQVIGAFELLGLVLPHARADEFS